MEIWSIIQTEKNFHVHCNRIEETKLYLLPQLLNTCFQLQIIKENFQGQPYLSFPLLEKVPKEWDLTVQILGLYVGLQFS